MFLTEKNHVHFIGIGGSGMFPIVQILHSEGYYITGSDNNESDIIKMVRDLGISVAMEQKAENIEGADLIVHTAAIMADNPELVAAKKSGVLVAERSEILGELTARYQNALCVSGTHGKTTTTAMLVQILLDAEVDPTCVIGGKLPAIDGYGRAGKSSTMVCESCEFVDTFLKLFPDVSVILNIDADHLDYFKTMDNLIASFRKFAQNTTRTLIVNGDDKNVLKAVEGLEKRMHTFGYSRMNDYYPENITHPGGVSTEFDMMHNGAVFAHIRLNVPGEHNILNAIAACVTAHLSGVTPVQCANGIEHFHGTGRRFEVLAEVGGITVVDDYAHHPTEVEAVLKAAKNLDFKRVWAVHQPFTYSRTKRLMGEFAQALQIADQVVLSEIMGSREKNTEGVFASQLAEKIPGSIWFPHFEEIADYVACEAQAGDLILTMGCGDVYKAARMIIERLENKARAE